MAAPIPYDEEPDETSSESCINGQTKILNSSLQLLARKLEPVDDKTVIDTNGIHTLSANKLLAVSEGVILKNGQAYLRTGRGGSLWLYHGYIPVWQSLGRHLELTDNPEKPSGTHFKFKGLEEKLLTSHLRSTQQSSDDTHSIKTLTLSQNGNLTAQNQNGETIWETGTFMAEADNVLKDKLSDSKAPTSVIHSKTRNLDWQTSSDTLVLLRNGTARLEWHNGILTFYRGDKPEWQPKVAGGPVWQGNGTLAIYNGAPYFVWGSYNWMHDVQVGNVLGISSQGKLMITDSLGCAVWEAPENEPRAWSTIKSRRQICKSLLADKWTYKRWSRKNINFDSIRCLD
ncbi:hypothetical protein EOPP23_09910 [Endozoicomonas sp. OPT23]|uniref:hypothetical protein n=1 Tax=Endozoicomonas sp. OPT23 TaxID=2072845 RepID=UPI00129BD74A|nr:hypothetical protein [Endozoicomonas sp. OPT23]MRI33297.1 hypothetical protein [Endozoicomonas sp. OPT23]